MICVECGDDDAAEDMVLCSDCLEFGPPQISIRVTRDKKWGDWVMDCWTHDVRGTYEAWEDAYEAAVGHACIAHSSIAVCRRKGHAWERKHTYPTASDFHLCRRCGETGYEIFGPWPVAIAG